MLPLLALPALLLGCSLHNGVSQVGGSSSPSPGTYATRAEAEAAAPRFGCSGAHQMGNRWMPCAGHGSGAGADHGGATP